MIDANQLKTQIERVAIGHGFRKERTSLWTWGGSAIEIGVCLTKTPEAGRYFIDVGFWMRELSVPESHEIHKAHMYFRAERLVPELLEPLARGLDYNHAGNAEVIAACTSLDAMLFPFLSRCRTAESLREFYRAGRFEEGLVLREARRWLQGGDSTTSAE